MPEMPVETIPTDTPDSHPYDTDSVYHRRVGVGTEDGVWIREGLSGNLIRDDHSSQVLEVYLMADA